MEILREFDEDVTGITGLRCLILIGRREKHALAVWSQRMIEGGPGGGGSHVHGPASHPFSSV